MPARREFGRHVRIYIEGQSIAAIYSYSVAMIGLNHEYAEPRPDRPAPDPLAYLQAVSDLFRVDGHIVTGMGLEHRPQQEAMANAVAQSFCADEALLFEAGTGVGKSLAYLLPGIIRAVDARRPLVVSTHTISLQDQIQNKDLPLCREILSASRMDARYAQFRSALLIGRSNYLCGTRLRQALETRTELFPSEEQKALERIERWARETTTGILQELNPAPPSSVWEWVNAEGSACNHRNCTPATCFYRRARETVRKAQVVIINHSLLFALIGAGARPPETTPGVIFPGDFVVLDEAHTVPAIATEHFGERVTATGLRRQLLRLHHPRSRPPRGLLHRHGMPADRRIVEHAIKAADHFFEHLAAAHLTLRRAVRLRDPEWTADTLSEPLLELCTLIRKRADPMPEGPARDELSGLGQIINSYRQSIANCVTLAQEDHVYWIEDSGRHTINVTLRSAPIKVAPYLNKALFCRRTSVLLTSATLAEGSTPDGFIEKSGAWGQRFEREQSPFDFENHLRVFIADDAPAPQQSQPRPDLDYLAATIAHCSLAVRGGSLVLFTNYADMHALASQLADTFRTAGRELLVQGVSGSRNALTRRMRAQRNAILFGTDSFWTGVDIPGAALSQVIITRLPFENPSHPIAEARAERCRDEGGSPFAQLQLPEALVKFRQGIGRLIRNTTDVGTITILDSRILNRRYGHEFIALLPKRHFERFDRASMRQTFIPLEAD